MIFLLILLFLFPIVQTSPICQLEKLLVCAINLQPLVNNKPEKNEDLDAEGIRLGKMCDELEKCSDVFLGCAKSVKGDKDLQKFSSMMERFPSHCDIVRLLGNEEFKPCAKKIQESALKKCTDEPPKNCKEWTSFGECAEKTVSGQCNAQNVETVKNLFKKHKGTYCK
ncbi:unnamed protein product [Caenorhabditis angaria]|uniref:T20D4.11-like domain-containing protein n=1 Tax=Caenorhabditis angaria TaxID=860376 RepID=A0A9P1IEA2_9PELO|nr:unnamed protein product [Caenorhabditis angaria]